MFQKLKDYSIVFSFDRSGFERHAKSFSPLNPAAFAGKHFLVTGGTRGIGGAVTDALVEMGAKVTVTARTSKDYDKRFANQANVSFVALDLGNFAQIMSARFGYFDGVVFNAGGMPSQLHVIEGEFDTIFGSQVVGHYLLMRRLMKERRIKPRSPVHWVSSGGMYTQRLETNDLAWQQRPYDKVKSYANAKRAQVILNGMLAQRIKEFAFSCSHPGWVGTAALAEALPGFTSKLKNRLRTEEQGADTILWCLEQGHKLKSGLFWFDRKARKTNPFYWTKEREAERLDLWNRLEASWMQTQSSAPMDEISLN